MKEPAETITPGSPVLFVLVRKATVDKVLEDVKGTGGKILKTSLSHDGEVRLQRLWAPPSRNSQMPVTSFESPDARSRPMELN